MGIVLPQLAPASEDRVSGAQVIDGSLKFSPAANSSGGTRLERTPSGSGNRRTWTWSAWVKRKSFFTGTNETHLFDSRVDDDDRFYGIYFAGPNDGNVLGVWEEYSSNNYYWHKTEASIRDTGWYHLVVAVDTTQAIAVNRVKFYANGQLLETAAENGSYPYYTENFETNVNQASSKHFIGSFNDARNFDGLITQNYLIDGLALGPGYFGFTDPLTNTWRPKKFRAEGTTVNDGTTWSGYGDGNAATNYEWTHAFDGSFGANDYVTGTSTYTTITFPEAIQAENIYLFLGTGTTAGLRINGVQITEVVGAYNNSARYKVGSNGEGNFLKTISLYNSGTQWSILYAIEVGGVLMRDGTTQNLDFGTNGFYLPFDGNSPIGHDKSNPSPINDGTVWSSGAGANFESGNPATNGFDGDASSYTRTDNANVTATVTLPRSVPFTTLQVRGARDSGNGTIAVNGTDVSSQFTSSSATLETVTITGVTSPLTSIALTGISGSAQPRFAQIIVDGVVLVDNMYGNGWTPVNFGGSNSLEKATGALPILNTTQGGTQAGVGVFGSKENRYYTLTGSSGSGSGYVFENEGTKPTLSMIRGVTYTFDYSAASSHPFRFATAADAAGSTEYTTGTSISGNVISFTVPHDAPATLYYYCTNHGLMGNSISVTTDETKADKYASNCVLAVPLVGGANDVSNQINSGSTTKAITTTNAVASSEASNFYDGSFYFDKTGDYLNTASSSDFTFGTGSFTVEGWFKYDSKDTYDPGFFQISDVASGSATYDGTIYLASNDANNRLYVNVGNDTSGYTPDGSFKAVNGKWYHIALVGDSGTAVRLYINGISQTLSGGSGSGSYDIDAATYATIGKYYNNGNYEFGGYIQDFRVYKGVAKYTSNFIPAATSPDILPDTPSGVSGSSKLTKITDGAVVFNGSSDYLSIAHSTDFDLTNGDFTLEGYFHHNHTSGYITGLGVWRENSGSDYWSYDLRMTQNGTVPAFIWSTNGTDVSGTLTATTPTGNSAWHHIAVTRSGTSLRIFVDGKLEASTTTSDTFNTAQYQPFICGYRGSSYYNGFMSNVRLIKGTALYTSSFAPPTRTLTNVTNTKLLTCQSPTNVKYSTIGPTIGTSVNTRFNSNFESIPTTVNSLSVTNNGSVSTTSAGTNSFGFTNVANLTGSNSLVVNIGEVPAVSTYDIIFKVTGTTNNKYLFAVGNTGIVRRTDSSVAWYNNNADQTLYANPDDGLYHHLRVTPNTLYIDGTAIHRTTSTSNIFADDDGYMALGAYITDDGTVAYNGGVSIGLVRIMPGVDLGAPSTIPITTNGTLSDTETVPNDGIIYAAGDSSASNFNPFNTDINTVRGQETGYPTWNQLDKGSGVTLSEGNSKASVNGSTSSGVRGTMLLPKSGKYFFAIEMIVIDDASDAFAGLMYMRQAETVRDVSAGGARLIVRGSGSIINDSTATGYTAFSAGDQLGVAVDCDTNTVQFYRNSFIHGVAQTPSVAITEDWAPHCACSSGTSVFVLNTGQKPFKFPPPDGFLPLNIANTRPETVITHPDKFVGALTYTGSGSTSGREITGLNFNAKPDLIWIKNRGEAIDHILFDSLRGFGANKELTPNDAYTEGQTGSGAPNTQTWGYVDSNNLNGFTVKSGSSGQSVVNNDGINYVAWCWRAGGNKGTFNIDDVDMGSAAAAGVSIGGQNSNAYNQTTLWRNSTTTTDLATNTGNDINSVFDGRLDTGTRAANINDVGVLQWSSGTIQGNVRLYLSISSDSDITYTANGTTTTVSSVPTGWYDLGNVDLTMIKVYYTSSGITFLNAIMVDGKILVDSDVSSPPDLPTIAATGCSIGTKQGFSIIKYTGTGSNGTISHGLTETPNVVLVKRLSGGTAYWEMFHSSVGKTKVLYLNVDDPATTSSASWNDREPVSNCFHVGSSSGTNASGSTYVAYCWHDVPGLQKFGSFTGNNDADGPFVELGFRPAVIIIYNTAGSNRWTIQDSTRSTFNPSNTSLGVNITDTELGSAFDLDFLSNGFKVRSTNSGHNADGASFIYLAWAEAPTVNLFGGQSNAR